MYLKYSQALVLQEIAKDKAEVYINNDPHTIYINGAQTGGDEVAILALERCKKHSLVNEASIDGQLLIYTINEAGKQELMRHFRKVARQSAQPLAG